jgi:hypothetical protein
MPTHDDDDGRLPTQHPSSGATRIEIPRPGRRLEFVAWCRLLTAELRRMLPAVSASTNGYDRVVWRYDGERVTGTNDRGCYRIQLNPRFGGLQDFERHDAHTATTMARSAGHFDAALSVADR